MRPLTLQEMAAAMGGRVLGEIAPSRVTSISTDSRRMERDSLFFAIKGERFDGHDFLSAAMERGGAVAAVVSSGFVTGPDTGPHYATAKKYQTSGRLIVVDDTVRALGRLARWYRSQLAAQVVAVLGSNGKTTTKNLIAAVLGSKLRGRAAPASFNNAIGVPLTLLSAEPSDEFVVTEIGTNHPGEIASLARIAGPDIAVVTSIGEEHLAYFGNLVNVAREEFSFLPSMQDRAFVALSDQAVPFAPRQLRSRLASRPDQAGAGDNGGIPYSLLTYGFDADADLKATRLRHDARGQHFLVNRRFDYTLRLLGRHNVMNALAAIAVGMRFRLAHEDIRAALAGVRTPAMRLEPRRLGPITIINDAYNANLSSMQAGIEALDDLPPGFRNAPAGPGRKVLILGDMRELGEEATRCHQAVGRCAGLSTAQTVIAVGAHARVVADGAITAAGTRKRIYAYPTIEALMKKLPSLLEPGDTVLLKASRDVGLERIIPVIEESCEVKNRE